jgi:D-3-phosphoglycerate dehydrogenase
MAKKVLLTQPIHKGGIELLQDNGIQVEIAEKTDEAYLTQKISECDGVIVRVTPMDRQLIAAAKKCVVIGRHGVGFDNVDIEAANEHNIPVVYAPGSNSNAVAEHTVALMFAVAKHIWGANMNLRMKGNYGYRLQVVSTELKGKTLGMIGLGNIGRRVATFCQKGLGMKIIGYDPYIPAELLAKEGLEVELVSDLTYLLKNADIVSLHMPGLSDKKKLIGKEELAMMKETAILVNTARGVLIDEDALYEALQTKKIAGAGLDVFDPEPPAANNRLFEFANVVATPHMAAHTEEGNRNMAEIVAGNVLAVLKGEKPKNIANPDIWEKRRVCKN